MLDLGTDHAPRATIDLPFAGRGGGGQQGPWQGEGGTGLAAGVTFSQLQPPTCMPPELQNHVVSKSIQWQTSPANKKVRGLQPLKLPVALILEKLMPL